MFFLVHSPDGHSSKDGARAKPGTFSVSLPRMQMYISRGLDCKWGVQVWTGTHMGFWYCRQLLIWIQHIANLPTSYFLQNFDLGPFTWLKGGPKGLQENPISFSCYYGFAHSNGKESRIGRDIQENISLLLGDLQESWLCDLTRRKHCRL